jgi:hypothetical protein
MPNPWLKKNPFMSMWLSGANSVAGSLRGQAAGQAKRQAASATTKAMNDLVGIWFAGVTAPPPKTRRRKRR